MRNRVRCAIGMIVLACAFEGRGQGSDVIDCETNAACMALFEQAQRQSKAGQLGEAEKSYRLAYEVSHDGRLLFSIGRVLDKRGQGAEAMGYYRQFIESPVKDEAQKERARELLAQLEAKQKPPSVPEPEKPTPPVPLVPKDGPGTTPVYKKGWFWGVLVGSVAAAGLGIGLGVGWSNRTETVPSVTVPPVPEGTTTVSF